MSLYFSMKLDGTGKCRWGHAWFYKCYMCGWHYEYEQDAWPFSDCFETLWGAMSAYLRAREGR